MSFILDALKKSETDRQRQSGPALFEVRVAPPRNALPLWAIGLTVLLAVNLVIVAWALLRHAAPAEQSAASVAAPQVSPGAAAPGMAMGASPPPQQGQTMPAPPLGAPVAGTAPASPLAQTAGMTASTAGIGSSQPGQSGSVAGPQPAENPQQPVNRAGMPGSTADATLQSDASGEKLSPDDVAPAADPAPAAPFGNRVTRNTASGVPLYQDAALSSQLPDLRLDLHAYAARPQERFVMINMRTLHEGDSLPNGVRVESITPEGAVLSHQGIKFLLPRN
jgi:general secretion pathway protein B